MDPPEFGTFRDSISEKGDFVILVTLLWPPWNENPNGASVDILVSKSNMNDKLIPKTIMAKHLN